MDNELSYDFLEKREARVERKRRMQNDRSQFKESDRTKMQEKREESRRRKLCSRTSTKGQIVALLSEGPLVSFEEEEKLCTLCGSLKKDKGLSKNLITVGDEVLIEKGQIIHVEPRRTFLSRADNLSRKKEQLIAANIDQVFITVSLHTPSFKPALIDRYLIAAARGSIKPYVLINKIDLYKELPSEERALYEEYVRVCEKVGIPLLTISAKSGEGLDILKHTLQGKLSLFSGQSGTGKTSLINRLGGFQLPIGEVRKQVGKGSHTTTTARIYKLSCGGTCVDTPGIQSFGVWDLKKEELQSYFPELSAARHQCRFHNCLHLEEEGCIMPHLVEAGLLSPVRYNSYRSLAMSLAAPHFRR